MTLAPAPGGIAVCDARLPDVGRVRRLPPTLALALPFTFTTALLAFTVFDRARSNSHVHWSFAGAALALYAWNAWLFATRRRRSFALERVLRPQHYVQACAHASIFLYWGWYWREVYASFDLLLAQLIFAYAFDMLLAWSRRDTYTLGFGPFPIILSTNLFLWFKPEWFYFQFLMIAVGVTAKELIRWDKDGKRTHIFNPSSFSLCVFSLALIVFHATGLTWGEDIAVTQFYPPHMYLFLFAIALPGQYLFGVTTMTLSAVLTTYLFGVAYYWSSGVYFFYDSYIPIAVFLGMHLLFTDPSTSPRSEAGRVVFGVLYGLSVVLLYRLLTDLHVPAFYDKLLPVPLLNLSVRALDRAVAAAPLRWFDPSTIASTLRGRRRHLAQIAVWAVVFAFMTATKGVSDEHPGQWLPFWLRACEANAANACAYLAGLETIDCRLGSGWACNELGILRAERRRDSAGATAAFNRGCRLGFTPACGNIAAIGGGGGTLTHAAPVVADLPIVVRGSKGPIRETSPEDLLARACAQGWRDSCTATPVSR
jgi:hypothetical protein